MSLKSEQEPPYLPEIRVFTFGECSLERLVTSPKEPEQPHYECVSNAMWQSRGTAISLLKVLLCKQRRRASRDELIDALWPEDEQAKMKNVGHAFDAAVSILRNVLRTRNGQSLLIAQTGGDGHAYKLADQERLWVDADAFEALVSQAIRADDPLPWWEQARALVRGEFLEDNRFSDWARARRQSLAADQSRMVCGLADCYMMAGQANVADEMLQRHIAFHPSDEDALCLLMSHLEQREKYHAAWRLYQRAREESKKDGLTLTPRTQVLARRIREKLVTLETNPSYAVRHPVSPITMVTEMPEIPLQALTQAGEQSNILPLLSQAITQCIIGVIRELEGQEMDKLRRRLLQQALGLTGIAITIPLQEVFNIADLSLMPESRQQLSVAITRPAAMNAEAFSHFQKLVDGCWGLCNSGEMNIAEQILSTFLPQIIQLAPYHSEAALLAAQSLRLRSILSAHQMKLADMIPLCQQAVVYARLANDNDTLSAALNGLAVAFKYAGQPEASFNTYQEALTYSAQASPLLRSRVYAGSAAAFAQRGRTQEALFYIGNAYEHFPEHPEDDPLFSSADNGIFMLAYYQGLMRLAMNQPEEAERAFESYKEHPSGAVIPERNRLEIINHRGRAAIISNNLERYADCLEEGLTGAIALKSKKRYEEALTFYHQDMAKIWLREPRIKLIAERFQLGQKEDK